MSSVIRLPQARSRANVGFLARLIANVLCDGQRLRNLGMMQHKNTAKLGHTRSFDVIKGNPLIMIP